MWLVRSNKAAGEFFVFQKVRSEPAGKEGNLQHDIKVLIVDSVIKRYLTLAKVGWSTFALQFFSCSISFSSALLFVASLLLFTYQLLFIILPVVSHLHLFILLGHFKFAFVSVLFVLLRSIICCSII
jgi:hypothetical protein